MKVTNVAQWKTQQVLLVLGTMVLTVFITLGVVYGSGLLTQSARQAVVAERGAQVMPFDLAQTTHVFQPRNDGGVQQVVAKDAANTTQIELIRTHLQAEAAKFRAGDFSDPAAIHGDMMPGLAILKTGFRSIDVRYETLPDGARIRYTTHDPALIAAIHAWFAAQGSDHGHDAVMH